MSTGFGGLYLLKSDTGYWPQATVTGGYVRNGCERHVANVGGFQTNTASDGSDPANPLIAGARELHIVNARAQLSSPNTFRESDGTLVTVEGRLGLDFQTDIGSSKVDTVVTGTPFTFNAAFDESQLTGFLGATLKGSSADGMSFVHASAEVHVDEEGGHEVRGQVNAGVNFLK